MNDELPQVHSIRIGADSDWIPKMYGDVHIGDNVFLTADSEDGVYASAWRHEAAEPLPYVRGDSGERFYILEGSAVITSHGGEAVTVSAGDMVFVPRGFTGTWQTLDRITKFAVVV